VPMRDFSRRNRQPELMDDPRIDPAEHARALRGLRRINRISRSSRLVWGPIRKLAHELPPPRLRVLDVASGGGDVAIDLARRAANLGIDASVDGCDFSATAVEHATAQAELAGCRKVKFFALDVLAGPLPQGYDVVMCSLFLHHLSEQEAVRLLRNMATAAGSLVLVNDLCRSRLGYALAWLGCRLLTRSRVVHVDGPRSVAAAFTVDEAARLGQTAGLRDVTISRHWPERFLLHWRRA
jgi:2-polyprenyl-3-methyl-5-hydroxy-6-metoxy-1,4-benzoquinol methylase